MASYQYRPANSPRGPLSATILLITPHVEVEVLHDATDKEETLLVSKADRSFERDFVKRKKKQAYLCNYNSVLVTLQVPPAVES